ncbi:hypothetical protein HQ584_06110 [Patescibacteria group bacterium]|nr:hypothetical protein [Patescibacteria group bacterium]
MAQEKLRPLKTYGNTNIFQKRVEEGYSKLAFGRIEPIDNSKLLGVFVFFHPDGKIATYEHPKQGTPFEKEYNSEVFQEYKEEQNIHISGKVTLEYIVKYLKAIE